MWYIIGNVCNHLFMLSISGAPPLHHPSWDTFLNFADSPHAIYRRKDLWPLIHLCTFRAPPPILHPLWGALLKVLLTPSCDILLVSPVHIYSYYVSLVYPSPLFCPLGRCSFKLLPTCLLWYILLKSPGWWNQIPAVHTQHACYMVSWPAGTWFEHCSVQ